ncbi:segregation/condensation protein A [Kurthia sibirica]|uniref:Segregation and condensation protein A n=1 Tax=Kurthia sibirica TaxID=202750 RepID=A0A2U3AR40_9BACL|nr:segregation/condensation protein A [Kurthia sibirica]PWI27012.1 segregation/condensation protein A [Kurthia sibirica]GEK34443.1 segregation and condensation protein A [Kurthia sibirica]
MSYKVKLEAFEGPLDLLLHLIHRLEIDIYDIPMREITSQYMEHIRAMQVLELNEASEYLVMAATLLEIKSKMLLPIHEEELDDLDMDLDSMDPRDELVNRLVEYRKFKNAASQFKEKESQRVQFYSRPPNDLSEYMQEEQLQLFDTSVNVFDMVAAFQKMLRRKILKAPLSTRIAKQGMTIKQQMKRVIDILKEHKGSADFFELFEANDKPTLVVTFLSLLELMKRQVVTVDQTSNFDCLTVTLRKEDVDYDELEPTNE